MALGRAIWLTPRVIKRNKISTNWGMRCGKEVESEQETRPEKAHGTGKLIYVLVTDHWRGGKAHATPWTSKKVHRGGQHFES